MKSYIYIIISCICLLSFFGCSYDEPEPPDTIPPHKTHLFPHKSDNIDSLTFYTDENNGIDAESAGTLGYNWMKIQWDDELKKDGDIHHIVIYRYNEYGDTTVADTIQYYPDSTKFIDTFSNYEDAVTQRTWSYFIIPYDEAGNFTVSDTVSYRLIDKPGLEYPPDNSTFSVGDSVRFSWFGQESYWYYILFFDESHNFQFAKNLDETHCNIPDIGFIPIPPVPPDTVRTYIWRIDAFDGVGGSESEERKITFY